MKTLIALFLLASPTIMRADTNSVSAGSRIWTSKNGNKFEGTVVDFRSTNQVVMVFAKDRKQYNITIILLADEDQKTLAELRPSFESRKSAKMLESRGYIEVTHVQLRDFPEKVDERQGWIDGTFEEVNNSMVNIYFSDHHFNEDLIGFRFRDKNGSYFDRCFANKNGPLRKGLENELAALKKGDTIRVVGKVVKMETKDEWLYADSIEVLEKAKQATSP